MRNIHHPYHARNEWKYLIRYKNAQKLTHLLNSGTFAITREDMSKFNRDATHIHYYFGVADNELLVHITDNKNDNGADTSWLITKAMTYSVNTSSLPVVNNQNASEVSPKEFLNRAFDWKLLSYNWIEHALENGIMFEGIINPINDYKREFAESNINEIYHFFGLHFESENLRGNKDEVPKIGHQIHGDISKYEIDLFCSYLCKKENGIEQNWEVSWPIHSKATLINKLNEVNSLNEW